jgi:hypothetical protein
MNNTFLDSFTCRSRAHCRTCRSDPAWRSAVGAPDECPHGIRGLGDLVELLAKPIAKALGLPCLDERSRLRPDSPCAKRRNALNRATL